MNRESLWIVRPIVVAQALLVLNLAIAHAQTPGQIPMFSSGSGSCNAAQGVDCVDSQISQDNSGNISVSGNVGISGVVRIDNGAYSQSSLGNFDVDAPFAPGGRFRIVANGNVGINNPNPANRLAVVGNSDSAAAIFGQASLAAVPGTGVMGAAGADGTGVAGSAITSGCGSLELCGATGVSGMAAGSTFNVGVAGSVRGGGIGVQGFSDSSSGFGVQGSAPNTGVEGVASSNAFFAAGIFGHATATDGLTRGVYGLAESSGGIGVHGIGATGGQFETGSGNEIIGRGFGSTNFRVDATGKVHADGGFQTGGADFAESMAVSGERSQYEPGDVVVIEQSSNRRVALAREPYSTLVAGIFSTKPGVVATPYAMNDPRLVEEIPLAVIGIVPCKVTAVNGAIKTGDLLVTSSISGHAMKGTDRTLMVGAVVGKALEPLASGTGVIQILVTLQ